MRSIIIIIVILQVFLSSILCQNLCQQVLCGTGKCVETENPILPYYCLCPNGSNSVLPCSSHNPCASNPCGSGICNILSNSPNGYLCQCLDHSLSFVGCNENFGGCYPNPCVNGVCRENETSVFCDCLSGWTGPSCEVKRISVCHNNPCSPGRCFSIDDPLISHVCLCPDGEFSQTCQDSVSLKSTCHSSLCANNGTCLFTPRGYQCLCAKGFTDQFCQTNIDECASNPCHFGGICHDMISSYICLCPDGSSRQQCLPPPAIELSHPTDNDFFCPCQNGGICAWPDDRSCLCPNGFTGPLCERISTKVQTLCDQIICANGGTCDPSTNSCRCPEGFVGQLCEKEYFRCPSNGRFTDRYNCINGKYFECVHDDGKETSKSHGILLGRQCPTGLRFNVLVDRCDYPENVHCPDI